MEGLDLINKNKNYIINAVVILVAVFIAFNIFQAQSKSLVVLKSQKEIEEKKNAVLSDIASLEKKITFYKSVVNRKEISSIISRIGNIAKESGVNLITIAPGASVERKTLLERYSFRVDIEADNYHLVGDFVSRLENSSDIYIVDSVRIRSDDSEDKVKAKKILADLIVTTVLIKD